MKEIKKGDKIRIIESKSYYRQYGLIYWPHAGYEDTVRIAIGGWYITLDNWYFGKPYYSNIPTRLHSKNMIKI